ncbi:MAG TPA: DNA recombination/repair protein RecA, partial [Candidatus Kapabacteria bacterium]|nr:DNA recombination/repair protein RecA [Candidatus Kapabacteria bacterium]
GSRTKVKIVKNKVAPPFKEVEFDILYNEGISKIGDLMDVAIEHGIITKSGSWFTYKDERVQGRDGLKKILSEKPELMSELEEKVRSVLNNNPAFSKTSTKTEIEL